MSTAVDRFGNTTAFDGVAPSYDATFTEQAIPRLYRDRLWRWLAPYARAGTRALDLGCGTGEDARYLAQRGLQVTALDPSPLMRAAAGRKCAGLSVELGVVDFDCLDPEAAPGPYDLVLSAFGALNCASALTPVGAWIAARTPPGAMLICVVMGPFCAWEIGCGILTRDLDLARRRRGAAPTARLADGTRLRLRFPSVRALTRALAPVFALRRVHGLGVLLPPQLPRRLDRRPIRRALHRADGLLAATPVLDRLAARLADHYVAFFQRQPTR